MDHLEQLQQVRRVRPFRLGQFTRLESDGVKRTRVGLLQDCRHGQLRGVREQAAPQCIDCFKTFYIGKAFVGSERCAIIAFSIESPTSSTYSTSSDAWPAAIELCSTATLLPRLRRWRSTGCHLASTCSVAIACIGPLRLFRRNMLAAVTESEHMHTEVYKAAHSLTKRILTLPSCGRQECKSCTYIKELTENQVVVAVLRVTQYTTSINCPLTLNLIRQAAWRQPLNCTGFQNFARKS